MPESVEKQIEELCSRSMQAYKEADYEHAFELAESAVTIARRDLGESHPLLANTLDNLATIHLSDPDNETAWRIFSEALEVQKRALGVNHPGVAWTLNNLARLHEAAGDYSKAEPLYREALEIYRSARGDDDPLYASALNNLAGLLQTVGDYGSAAQLYSEAIASLRKGAGDRHPTVAKALNNLASLHTHLGNYSAAEQLFVEAIEIEREAYGEGHAELAHTLNNHAQLYELTGNYAAAEPIFLEALEIRRKTVGENDPGYARVLSNLAGLYESMGNYTAAAPLYHRVIKIDELALGEHHQTYATDLNNLATLYQATAQYAEAEDLYKQALEIDRLAVGKTHTNYAMDLSNLASLYEAIGDYEKAIPLAEQALQVFRAKLGEKHHYVSAVLDNLALLHQRLARYDLAEKLLREALDIQKIALGPEHALIAKTLNSLGFVAYERGDYDGAEGYYRRALSMQRRVLGRTHPNVAASLSNLGIVYAAKSQLPRALALMRRANEIDDLVVEQVFGIGSEVQRMDYLVSLKRDLNIFLSLITRYMKNSPRACKLGAELVLRRKGLGTEALAAQREAILGGLYPSLIGSLSRLTILRRQIARRALGGPGEEGIEAHEELLAGWNLDRGELERELSFQIPEIRLESHFRNVRINVVAEAIPDGSTLIEIIRYTPFDFETVEGSQSGNDNKKQLGDGDDKNRSTSNRGPWKAPHYLAFVLERGGAESVQMVDLGEAESLDRLIDEFRAFTLKGPGAPAEISFGGSFPRSVREKAATSQSSAGKEREAPGHELRKRLFEPLSQTDCLSGSLLVSLDGDLNRLPIGVLPLEDGGHLMDKYRISYLSAGRDILRITTNVRGNSSEPVVAADPDFDLSRAVVGESRVEGRPDNQVGFVEMARSGFRRLTGTATEGQQVGALLNVEPLLGTSVLYSRLMKVCSPRILHIATHGFFLPRSRTDFEDALNVLKVTSQLLPESLSRLQSLSRLDNPMLRSGLVLAGVNRWLRGEALPSEAEDGILTAEDVTGLDLIATELVVLSACDTGLGQIESGEGVYGLCRAFMLAGARALVISLWKVPDIQTQELMAEFYQGILTGHGCADSLREAQLSLRARYPATIYWGAFICQGNPGPISI